MRRSKYRRANDSKWFSGRRRIIAVAATLAAFGGIVTVTQISSASTNDGQKTALAACNNLKAGGDNKLSTNTRRGTYTTNNGQVTQHPDDGAGDVATTEQVRARCRDWVMQNVGNNTNKGRGGKGNNNNGGGNNNGGAASSAPAAGASGAPASAPAGNGGNNNGGGGNNGGNNNGGNNGGGNNNGGGATAAPSTAPPGAGLGILTNSCATSNLPAHDGFQKGDRCVSTEFGEVGSAANNPSLLITQSPRQVNRNQAFTLQVSTRNLIRDRFLAAGQGGYYVESSVLQNGLVRGHFHTACRMLANNNEAPAPEPVPAFFVATEDSKGGRTPDSVTIQVPGLPQSGTAQCASWAGDGSHRIPMMERANQTPAFDVVRVQVR
ncbi:hypothetical protein Acy02nite_52360 [Actinoplanes cyaneus]|uniref:Pecanex-like protein 1 n=1 Tax=Actinoplanes cyaneus TaxID=52696 RepID=A0A919M2K4_9ACTN|nr:Pecanex-like protein 1 [Actinoplanes cyaneus]MCW2140684.1 hypothetical protein [Actinoplanes cyaneus]GID67355.1 hypothetical protein Acy02nite_52360 [Actinoplanes cyaneus]